MPAELSKISEFQALLLSGSHTYFEFNSQILVQEGRLDISGAADYSHWPPLYSSLEPKYALQFFIFEKIKKPTYI